MQRLGQTRSAHRHDHMLLTSETFVRAPLPASWRIWIEGEGGHAGAVPMPQGALVLAEALGELAG